MPLVILLRLLLLSPFLLTSSAPHSSPHLVLAILGAILQARQTNSLQQHTASADIVQALHQNSAVSTLGYDALIGVLSGVVYYCVK